MTWINSWQRAEAINATNEIIGPAGSLAEYERVLGILEKAFGADSDGARTAFDFANHITDE